MLENDEKEIENDNDNGDIEKKLLKRRENTLEKFFKMLIRYNYEKIADTQNETVFYKKINDLFDYQIYFYKYNKDEIDIRFFVNSIFKKVVLVTEIKMKNEKVNIWEFEFEQELNFFQNTVSNYSYFKRDINYETLSNSLRGIYLQDKIFNIIDSNDELKITGIDTKNNILLYFPRVNTIEGEAPYCIRNDGWNPFLVFDVSLYSDLPKELFTKETYEQYVLDKIGEAVDFFNNNLDFLINEKNKVISQLELIREKYNCDFSYEKMNVKNFDLFSLNKEIINQKKLIKTFTKINKKAVQEKIKEKIKKDYINQKEKIKCL